MPTNFPTSVDNFTNPTANDSLNLPSHSTQHANANDAIEAVEDYLLNGGQGLTLVKKQVIGSAVSSVNVTGAFSATYENYKIVVSGGVGSGAIISLRLGASTTGYFNTLVFGNTWASPTATGASTNNGSLWNFIGYSDANQQFLNCDISQPFLSKYSFINGSYVSDTNAGAVQGVHKVATSYTDFTLVPAAGTFTGGTIYVYGYGLGQ